MEKLQQLKQRLAEIEDLNRASLLISWDQQTQMPPAGAEARAHLLGTLSKLTHEKQAADEIGKLIEDATAEVGGLDADSDDAALLRAAKRDYDQAACLPTEFVAEFSRVTSMAFEIWAKARAGNQFKDFQPSLERIVELTRQQADYLGYTDHPYDALLDLYEPDMKTAQVRAIFDELKKDLVPLVQAITSRPEAIDDACLHQAFDEDAQRNFTYAAVKELGYDFNRGRIDRAVHPFATRFSINDVRMTTRCDPKYLNAMLFGTLHETGHALYELGVNPAYERLPLGRGASLGIHESQSRLWENLVGRSRAFWLHFYPQLQAAFPAQLSVDLDTFYRAINRVKPSFVRVEADEVTYNLHIMLRFELEQEMIEGAVQIADLPEIWNARFQEYLGVTPPTDALGVLQDMHWSVGLIGYFATYALGNLISAQLWEKVVADVPDLSAQIARGEFGPLREWLQQNVHRHGRKYMPDDLVRRVTGESIQSRSFMRYLRSKYGEIYELAL